MILDIGEYPKFRDENLKGKIVVVTSGFFDPPHPGHVSLFEESKKLGEVLVVLLNGDMQAVAKKGKAFMPAKDRAYIINAFKCVDHVVIYDAEGRTDSNEAIAIMKPEIFAKGGDRDMKNNVPEVDTVESYGGKVIYNVGNPKIWSSSNYLEEWVEFKNASENN